MPASADVKVRTVGHRSVHRVAIICMARVFQIRIVAAPLLSHIFEGKVRGSFVYIFSDPELGRRRRASAEKISSGSSESGEVQPVSLFKGAICSVAFSCFALVNNLPAGLVNEFEIPNGCQ